jgi:hypothetical protein
LGRLEDIPADANLGTPKQQIAAACWCPCLFGISKLPASQEYNAADVQQMHVIAANLPSASSRPRSYLAYLFKRNFA